MRSFFGRLDRAWWGLPLPVHYVVLGVIWGVGSLADIFGGGSGASTYDPRGIRKFREERLSRVRGKR